MFRWDDNPSDAKPLLKVNAPELTQVGLSRPTKQHTSAMPSTSTTADGKANEEFTSVIEEIESLVKELDTVYDLKRGERKNKQ